MLSRMSDRFYGQWLVLHVPFRSIGDFLLSEEDDSRVPKQHRYMAMFFRCNHRFAQRYSREQIWMEAEMQADVARPEVHHECHPYGSSPQQDD